MKIKEVHIFIATISTLYIYVYIYIYNQLNGYVYNSVQTYLKQILLNYI